MIEQLVAGTKTMEFRSRHPPQYLKMCTISLMETGTRLTRGTAVLAESGLLTTEEQFTFADVLQAHDSVRQITVKCQTARALSRH